MILDNSLVGKVFLLMYSSSRDNERMREKGKKLGFSPHLNPHEHGGMIEVTFKPDNYAMFNGEIGYRLDDARLEDGTEFDVETYPHGKHNLVQIKEVMEAERLLLGEFYSKRSLEIIGRKVILKVGEEFKTPPKQVGKERESLGSVA